MPEYVMFARIEPDIRLDVETMIFGTIPIPEEIVTAGYPDSSVDNDDVTTHYVFLWPKEG